MPACGLTRSVCSPTLCWARETQLRNSSKALRNPGGFLPVGPGVGVGGRLTNAHRKPVSRPACHLVLRTAVRGDLPASSALLLGHRLPCLAPLLPSLLREPPGSPRPQGQGEGTSPISIHARLRAELLGS